MHWPDRVRVPWLAMRRSAMPAGYPSHSSFENAKALIPRASRPAWQSHQNPHVFKRRRTAGCPCRGGRTRPARRRTRTCSNGNRCLANEIVDDDRPAGNPGQQQSGQPYARKQAFPAPVMGCDGDFHQREQDDRNGRGHVNDNGRFIQVPVHADDADAVLSDDDREYCECKAVDPVGPERCPGDLAVLVAGPQCHQDAGKNR